MRIQISDDELLNLHISRFHLFADGEPVDRARRIFGAEIIANWHREEQTNALYFPIEGSGKDLVVDWRRYTRTAEDANRTDEAFIGNLTMDGQRLDVTESCLRIYQTNSGALVFDGEFTSTSGVCCNELLRAASDQTALERESTEIFGFSKTWNDDIQWHDADFIRTYIRLRVDVAAKTAYVRRIFLKDASS
jgi:hypothetical protein